jgi:hypothetical protein
MEQYAAGESREPWTAIEIEAAISAYLDMLQKERRGERYTKRDVVRNLQVLVPARSSGSIEFKFGNISAVLDEVGLPMIDGYKPYPNYQRDLRAAVLARLGREQRIGESIAEYGTTSLMAPQREPRSTDDVLVPPPNSGGNRVRSRVGLTGGPISALRDYQTKQLGDAGEEWVVDLERERLARIGRLDLADLVEWTARERGDGAGFDVSSFFPDGRQRFIEVKTTNYSVRTPFYITRWEVDFSDSRPDAYSLYRVHGFARDPRIYVLDGSISNLARLEPKVFLGIPV